MNPIIRILGHDVSKNFSTRHITFGRRYRTLVSRDLVEIQDTLRGNIIPRGTTGKAHSEDYETGGIYLQFDKPVKVIDSQGKKQVFKYLRYDTDEIEEV